MDEPRGDYAKLNKLLIIVYYYFFLSPTLFTNTVPVRSWRKGLEVIRLEQLSSLPWFLPLREEATEHEDVLASGNVTLLKKIQKEKTAWSHICMKSKKVEYIETESQKVITRAGSWWKLRDASEKAQNFSYMGWISSRDLRYSMVSIIILYTEKLRCEYISGAFTTKMKKKKDNQVRRWIC